jgi:hypothetical protein
MNRGFLEFDGRKIPALGSWLLYTQPKQTKELYETLGIPFWLDYPEFASHG